MKSRYKEMHIVLLGIVVLGIILCFSVYKAGGFPKIVDTITTEAVVLSHNKVGEIYYIHLPNTIKTGIRQMPPVEISANAYATIQVGQSYLFVIDIWSNGWGPRAVLSHFESLETK